MKRFGLIFITLIIVLMFSLAIAYGSVLLKRTALTGWYAIGTIALPEVDTLTTSDSNLINTPINAFPDDPGYTTATGVNIGNNGNDYYNIGIQLSLPQNVDTLYIYVKSDTGNPGNITWNVYRSPTNGPGPWTNIVSGLNVAPTVFNSSNNIYRYELNFASSNNLYFKAINMTKSGFNNVFVTEIEAYGTEQVNEVLMDIKPGSCPNPFRLPQDISELKGKLPVAILGTEHFDVTTIDPDSIRITREGVEGEVTPLRYRYEDVATPFEGELCGCHDFNGDGYMDLILKFKRKQLAKILNLYDVAGQTIPLTIIGNLKEEYGGTQITGQDCVRIKVKKAK